MNPSLTDAALPELAERPSKTQRKQEMTALQDLGAQLVKLNAEQLSRVALPEELAEAIKTARRITAHEAKRRQLQYVGRLMRRVDPEPIRRALAAIMGDSKESVTLMHRCERWRDRLIDDDEALTELMQALPGIEAQPLRTLIRAARRERLAGTAPKQTRALYQWLYQQWQSDGDPP